MSSFYLGVTYGMLMTMTTLFVRVEVGLGGAALSAVAFGIVGFLVDRRMA